jgi:hypothetical protein
MDNDDQVENLDAEASIERESDIEQVRYFVAHEYENVQDENGISYKLNYVIKEVRKIPIFESEKTFNNDSDTNWNYIIVGSYDVTYKYELFSNGNLINTVVIEGILLKVAEYKKESDLVLDGTLKWCDAAVLYFPELDNDRKKEIIFGFTGGDRYCLLSDEVTRNRISNLSIEAVKQANLIE